MLTLLIVTKKFAHTDIVKNLIRIMIGKALLYDPHGLCQRSVKLPINIVILSQ